MIGSAVSSNTEDCLHSGAKTASYVKSLVGGVFPFSEFGLSTEILPLLSLT
jgi:hypothetical protein